jgi:hypothetical protein
MNAKYADVIGSAEVIDYLRGLPDGLFELPSGNGVDHREFSLRPGGERRRRA